MLGNKGRSILKALRRARADAGLTISELAERAGVARDTISKLETGQRRAYPTTIRKLATSLGVEPQELVEEREGRARTPEVSKGQEEDKSKKKRLGF